MPIIKLQRYQGERINDRTVYALVYLLESSRTKLQCHLGQYALFQLDVSQS